MSGITTGYCYFILLGRGGGGGGGGGGGVAALPIMAYMEARVVGAPLERAGFLFQT